MIDISAVLTADEPFELQLVHPVTREPIDVTISIVGMDSAVYRKVAHAQRARRIKNIKPGSRNLPVSMDELEADAIEILAECTTGWKNLAFNGSELPFSKENAVMVYSSPKTGWVREQVDEAISDRANFSKESSKDS